MWRIKAEIYVQALVRRVNAECVGVIARRGDTDAGGIYVRVNRLDGRSGLLVAFTDMNGETTTTKYSGMTARSIQHEYDHLDGVLFQKRANRIHLDKARKDYKMYMRRRKKASGKSN